MQEQKPYEQTFEKLWKLYPEKKGKGKIKTERKKELHRIGCDHMARAIQRYVEEVQQKRAGGFQLAYQYGSTFFISGYIDYLDKNYTPSEAPKTTNTANKTGFHLPPETSRAGQYTNDQLEKILLNRKRPRERSVSNVIPGTDDRSANR